MAVILSCCKSIEIELKANYYFLKTVHNPLKTIFLIEAFGVFITTPVQKKDLWLVEFCRGFKVTLMYNRIQTSLKERFAPTKNTVFILLYV